MECVGSTCAQKQGFYTSKLLRIMKELSWGAEDDIVLLHRDNFRSSWARHY
jgi:hypothetical protein